MKVQALTSQTQPKPRDLLKLDDVRPVESYPDGARAFLTQLYRHSDLAKRFVGTVLNSCLAKQRPAFALSRGILVELLAKETNWEVTEKDVKALTSDGSKLYTAVLDILTTQLEVVRVLSKRNVRSPRPYVFEFIDDEWIAAVGGPDGDWVERAKAWAKKGDSRKKPTVIRAYGHVDMSKQPSSQPSSKETDFEEEEDGPIPENIRQAGERSRAKREAEFRQRYANRSTARPDSGDER